MENSKRDVQLHFMVNKDEREVINNKMDILGVTNMAEYLRRMCIYGYMIEVDMQPLNAITTELSRIGNNINQIARRANETGNLYIEDIEQVSADLKEMKNYLKEFTIKISNEM